MAKIKFKKTDQYLHVWELEGILSKMDKSSIIVLQGDPEGNFYDTAYGIDPFMNGFDTKECEPGHIIDAKTTEEEIEDYYCIENRPGRVKKAVIISP